MSECPRCGAAAYVGFTAVECTNIACEMYCDEDPDKTPKMWRKPIWEMSTDELDDFLTKK